MSGLINDLMHVYVNFTVLQRMKPNLSHAWECMQIPICSAPEHIVSMLKQPSLPLK